MSNALKVHNFTSGAASEKGNVGRGIVEGMPPAPVLAPAPAPVLAPVLAPVHAPPLSNSASSLSAPAPKREIDNFSSDLEVGGSIKPIQEFDNNKELKDFIKIFKKQNRKSYKSKNSSTRRNKKNNK